MSDLPQPFLGGFRDSTAESLKGFDVLPAIRLCKALRGNENMTIDPEAKVTVIDCTAVAELIAADEEYDAAQRALEDEEHDETTAAFFHAHRRFGAAYRRRRDALVRCQGGAK